MDQGVKRTMSDIAELDKRVVEVCSMAALITFGPTFSFDQLEPIIESNIGMTAIDLIDHCGAAARYFSSAAMKLAAVMTAIQSPEHRAHAFGAYRALVLMDFDSMPKCAHALVRQASKGSLSVAGSATYDVLARGLDAFDPKKAGNCKIQISDDDRVNAANLVRATTRMSVSQH
jgi:hypothetical protein